MTISVVIPTYNAASFIGNALDSLFWQSRLPDEVIVADDCSRDDTVAIVEQMSKSSPVPIRVIRLPANSGGPVGPLNVGFDQAIGEYIATLDQDDIFLPNKLERQAAILDACPEASFVFGESGRVHEPDYEPARRALDTLKTNGAHGKHCLWATILSGPELLTALFRFGNFVTGFPGFIFRKVAWTTVRPLDNRLRIAADYDFLFRLCRLGPAAYVPETHYLRRIHDANMVRFRAQTELEIARVRHRHWRAISSPQLRCATNDIRQ